MTEVWFGRVRKAMLNLRTSPRRWQEHFVWPKLKEHGFVQDERDPCRFANTELDICIGVRVDDMLAVGPSELTKNLLQETLERHGNALGFGVGQASRVPWSILCAGHRKATRLESRVTT